MNFEAVSDVAGCDVNCKRCTTNGEGKCDSGQCSDRYVLDSDNTCEGNRLGAVRSHNSMIKSSGRLVRLSDCLS